jgi:hypothetical protein
MRKTKTITEFHPKAPKRLITLYRKCGGNCYAVAKKIEVNPSQVWQLLKKGIEPKRNDIRRRMFLSYKKSAEELAEMRSKKVPVPEYVRRFGRLPKVERYKVMQQYITWKDKQS